MYYTIYCFCHLGSTTMISGGMLIVLFYCQKIRVLSTLILKANISVLQAKIYLWSSFALQVYLNITCLAHCWAVNWNRHFLTKHFILKVQNHALHFNSVTFWPRNSATFVKNSSISYAVSVYYRYYYCFEHVDFNCSAF